MPFAPLAAGFPQAAYLFVDGGALRGKLNNVANAFGIDGNLEIDFRQLQRGFAKTFYYDAFPAPLEGESDAEYGIRTKPERDQLDAIASIDGIHVYEGNLKRSRRRGREQKRVDVALAVDMMMHAVRRNMNKATLLTGDDDFKPLIDALIQEGLDITVWYPVNETSRSLLNAADARRALNVLELRPMLKGESAGRLILPVEGRVHAKADVKGMVIHKADENGREVQFIKHNNGELSWQIASGPTEAIRITSTNLDHLRFYCRDVHGSEMPEF